MLSSINTMDPKLSNFIIMAIASSVGGVTALVGSFSACCITSRCTHIKSGCVECDRDVMNENKLCMRHKMILLIEYKRCM